MSATFIYKLIEASEDNTVREVIVDYIKTNFADTLGGDIFLLNSPGGLELLAQKYGLPSLMKTQHIEKDDSPEVHIAA